MTSTPTSSPFSQNQRWTWEERGWIFAAFWLIFMYNPIAATVDSSATWAWKAVSYTGVAIFSVFYVCLFRFEARIMARVGLRGMVGLILLLSIPSLMTLPAISYVALAFIPYFGACSFTLLPYRFGFFTTVLGTLLIGATVWSTGKPWLWFFLLWLLFAAVPAGLGRYMGEKSQAQSWAIHRALMAEDRDRMARDMHDVLGHTLTVLAVKAELAEKLLDKDLAKARTELQDVQSMTRQALAEVRSTVAGLRVARLQDELAEAESACTSAGITFDAPDDVHTVDPAHRIVFAWALRESVTNVVRHAKATTVTIRWGADWLTVSDDGVGLRGSKEGHGLAGVRERVEQVGGTFTASSPSSGGQAGTTVTVRL